MESQIKKVPLEAEEPRKEYHPIFKLILIGKGEVLYEFTIKMFQEYFYWLYWDS